DRAQAPRRRRRYLGGDLPGRPSRTRATGRGLRVVGDAVRRHPHPGSRRRGAHARDHRRSTFLHEVVAHRLAGDREPERAPPVAAVTVPHLGVLLALADGRSANEVKDLLPRPGPCIGHVFAIGRGEDEVVLVGAPRPGDTVGAVLWVDRGWWRIAPARIGYTPWVYVDSRRDDARELIVGIDSGGSAGTIGLTGVRLRGPAL